MAHSTDCGQTNAILIWDLTENLIFNVQITEWLGETVT